MYKYLKKDCKEDITSFLSAMFSDTSSSSHNLKQWMPLENIAHRCCGQELISLLGDIQKFSGYNSGTVSSS